METVGVLGWIAVGPMEAVCAVCAPCEADVHARYSPHQIHVEPLRADTRLPRLLHCAFCRRPIATQVQGG